MKKMFPLLSILPMNILPKPMTSKHHENHFPSTNPIFESRSIKITHEW